MILSSQITGGIRRRSTSLGASSILHKRNVVSRISVHHLSVVHTPPQHRSEDSYTAGGIGLILRGLLMKLKFRVPWCEEILAMLSALPLRTDYSPTDLRSLAKKAKDNNQSRRLLSLDGMNRTDAARIGGMDRQTLRDWVVVLMIKVLMVFARSMQAAWRHG